ncbi:MAG: IS110 family transposase [Bacteroidota bacterium]
MSQEYLQQAIGIDVSKKKLQCRHGLLAPGQEIKLKSSKTLDNSKDSFDQLVEWIEKHTEKYPSVPLRIVLEATGRYHEQLIYFLNDQEYELCVILPKNSKFFARSITKTKNDEVDAGMLARMGLERKLEKWQAPPEELKTLKELTRELTQLKKEATRLRNQQEAKTHAYRPEQVGLDRIEKRLELIEQQIKEVECQIDEQVDQNEELKQTIERIEQVEGLGKRTILTVIAETYGFALFTSIKQLCSYVGLDVIENQSGNFYGKTRISKAGNTQIRTALYFPAMTAARCNPTLSVFYGRLLDNGKAKKQALVAVARKLLILIYSLWKSGQEYRKGVQE